MLTDKRQKKNIYIYTVLSQYPCGTGSRTPAVTKLRMLKSLTVAPPGYPLVPHLLIQKADCILNLPKIFFQDSLKMLTPSLN